MKFVTSTDTRFQQIDSALRNQQASIQNLETQIGQISKMLSERPSGSLPNTTESNPREHCKAITLRSGKKLTGSSPLADKGNIIMQDEPTKEGPDLEVVDNKRRKEDRQKSPVWEHQPPVPYPMRLRQDKVDKHYSKFLDLFKQLKISLPFVEAILQMPKYAKLLKEILSNKRKLEDLGQVVLNEKCSAILQNKLPLKRRDPGSFTIIVDKFIFPVDFVVMDMEGESTVPLILGRPFLATSRVVIDVSDGKLKLIVDDETITFDLATSMRQPLDYDNIVYSIDVIDDVKVKTSFEDQPVLELKELPSHLVYAFLDEEKRLPVIIAADLTPEEQAMLLEVLRKYKKAFAFKIVISRA
ncbi:uncharacterized protein LOC125369286 [Ricinus communis]|uniref:uncharacterized protein LOC125369286 n=1 Tax=Ricinus communis TaxID=3988 RepID=UPI00201ADEC2|nr:uncharacterized protein LOC125369286 [Ricinus communis]